MMAKIKCMARQELVIGSFTEPEGTRAGLGNVAAAGANRQ